MNIYYFYSALTLKIAARTQHHVKFCRYSYNILSDALSELEKKKKIQCAGSGREGKKAPRARDV